MGSFIKRWWSGIKDFYSTEDSNKLNKIKTYHSTDKDLSNLSRAELLLHEIKSFVLPFKIHIDENGNIVESYNVHYDSFSWTMKKVIEPINRVQYQVTEVFEDSNGTKVKRVFRANWLVEFHYLDITNKIVYNYVKEERSGSKYVSTPDTEALYSHSRKRIRLSSPEDIANYIPVNEEFYSKRLILKNDNIGGKMVHAYITSLNPDNDGLGKSSHLVTGNNNIYDGDLQKDTFF